MTPFEISIWYVCVLTTAEGESHLYHLDLVFERLAHQDTKAPVIITVDAPDSEIGGVTNQWVNHTCQPIAFFSKSLLDTVWMHGTSDRKLLAIYCGVRYFKHFVKNEEFTPFIGHKPLNLSLRSSSDT